MLRFLLRDLKIFTWAQVVRLEDHSVENFAAVDHVTEKFRRLIVFVQG